MVAFVAINSDSKSLGKVVKEVGIQRVEGTTRDLFIYLFLRLSLLRNSPWILFPIFNIFCPIERIEGPKEAL
jgi:hypothetical protein